MEPKIGSGDQPDTLKANTLQLLAALIQGDGRKLVGESTAELKEYVEVALALARELESHFGDAK